mgnify:CR=1 FL=1
MSTKLSLSVILPIKSSKTRNFDEYFEKAITSIKTQQVEIEELVIVHSSEESLITFLNEYDFESLNVVKLLWDKGPSYCDQVNYGISNAKGTWISLFEFDDEYSSIWFKNVQKYVNSYPQVQAFLPVVVETDEKGVFAGFTNEATFAANFSQEIGFLTNDGNWGLQVDSSKNVRVYGLSLTIGNTTSSDIYMVDTDEGNRRIHCNSGRVGFLSTSNTWGSWAASDGSWHSDQSMRAPIFYDSDILSTSIAPLE